VVSLTEEQAALLERADMRLATILGFQGTWGSGLGSLVLSTPEGEIKVPCDNGATVRALEAAFGDVIGDAHDVRGSGGHVGKQIIYSMDEMGLVLGGFTKADDQDEVDELLDRIEMYFANEDDEDGESVF
jgi:hypothetical protein